MVNSDPFWHNMSPKLTNFQIHKLADHVLAPLILKSRPGGQFIGDLTVNTYVPWSYY